MLIIQQNLAEMIAGNLILILFINFLHYAITEDSDLSVVTTAQPWQFMKFLNPKIKREVVNLEVFDDIKQVKEEDKSENDSVIFVCGNQGEIDCTCNDLDLKRMDCESDKLKTANLKPIIEDFGIQKVYLSKSKNLTFEKGKTFPGNEETIKFMHLHNIKMINFENNVFDTFTNLEMLWFWNNPISNIDERILTENFGKVLINLDLFKCNLSEINPAIFKNLINLKNLELQGNEQINGKINGKFPEGLQNLKFLDLSSCNLSSLNHDTFENLRSLEDLFLSSNKFTSIPTAIKFLRNLKMFIFLNNLVEKIEKNEFVSNVKLENINFFNNLKLQIVGDCAFCNLKNLKVVSFSESKNLTYIDENAFGAISNGFSPKLDKFNIGYCNISVLHENLLDWKNVKELNIIGNPFACNCSMAWLFKDLMSDNSIYEKKLSHNFFNTHHKFTLGCLGPSPRTPNHTYPYTVVEIFSSCENSSSSFTTILWYFFAFLCFIVLLIVLIYANRSRLQNFLSNSF